MNENKKISIIVPIYNTENYIEKAIESIIHQTIGFENIELICIDDASTDNSANIIDDYASKYDNIIVIHLEENSKYAGRPRNIGLKKANSDYIMFLDSDDYFAENACEVLYNKISSDSNLDIVIGESIILLPNGEKKYVNHISNNSELFLDKSTLELFKLDPAISARIFKRDFLLKNNIKFPEFIPGQDLVFLLNAFCFTDKILSINNFNVYNRVIRLNESISFNINKDYLSGLLKAYTLVLDSCVEHNILREYVNLLLTNHLSFFSNQIQKTSYDLVELFNSREYIKFKNHIFFKNNDDFGALFFNLDNKVYNNVKLLEYIKEVSLNRIESNNLDNDYNYSFDKETYDKLSQLEDVIIDYKNEKNKLVNRLNMLNDKNNYLYMKNKELIEENEELKNILKEITSSKSWKYTKIFRKNL